MNDTDKTEQRPPLTQDAVNQLFTAIDALREAWTNPGQHAGFHEYQKQHLHNRWPSLETALAGVLAADPRTPAQAAARVHAASKPTPIPDEDRADYERNRDEIVGYPAYSGGPNVNPTEVEVIPASQSSTGWAQFQPPAEAGLVSTPNPSLVAAAHVGRTGITLAEVNERLRTINERNAARTAERAKGGN